MPFLDGVVGRTVAPRPIEERFWARTTKGVGDECWIFDTKALYGSVGINFHDRIWLKENGMEVRETTSRITASRFSFFLHKGPICKGLYVCHSCDNPPCVNPQHLWLGTQLENWEDMVRKGRAKLVKGGKTKGMTGQNHGSKAKELVAASKRNIPRTIETRSKISKTRLEMGITHSSNWKNQCSVWMKKYHALRRLGKLKTQLKDSLLMLVRDSIYILKKSPDNNVLGLTTGSSTHINSLPSLESKTVQPKSLNGMYVIHTMENQKDYSQT